MTLIVANTVSLFACILLVLSGFLKKKNNILIVQTVQIMLFIISNLLLDGFAGAIANIFGIIRNILCYTGKYTKVAKFSIIAITILFSAIFNNFGFIGYAPVLATALYAYFLDTKNIVFLKCVIIVNTLLWCIYDFYIGAFVTGIFDVLTIITNTISIFQIKYKLKRNVLNVKKN